MPQIVNIGHWLKTDENGFFVNESSVEKIRSPWKEGVEEIKSVYLEHLGDLLHSVYIRGSVSRGEAIEEISDIDTFAIVNADPKELDFSWLQQEQKRLEQKYSFSTGVELEVKSLNELMAGEKYFHALSIKAMAACVYGEDLASKLRKFRPDIELAQRLHGDLAKRIEQTKTGIVSSTDGREIQTWCAFIMKRIIRSGCALLIESTGTYSRDLYPCYQVFAEYHPEKSQEMFEALDFAVNPIENKTKILTVLNTLGRWLVEQISNIQ